MIIHSLSFCGIGPFKDEYAIDFAALTANGLFLFDGPTGSGKSTLIDAITFALFGEVAGKESSKQRIRSTHADPQTESWVELVFRVSSGTYRIRRTPAWLRLKRKATKLPEKNLLWHEYQESDFTKINETAKLWKLSAESLHTKDWAAGELIAGQVRDVRPMVEEIIGLNKDQFLQTVVLPQGQFAQFLRLKSTERQPILEAIFRTKRYREFTEKLLARAKQSLTKIAQEKAAYQHAIQTWLANQGLPAQEKEAINTLLTDFQLLPDSAENADTQLLSAINAAQKGLSAQAKEAAIAAEKAQNREEECRTVLANEEKLKQAIRKRQELQAQLAQLTAAAKIHAQHQQKLELAEKATLPNARINDYQETLQQLQESVPKFQGAGEKLGDLLSAAEANCASSVAHSFSQILPLLQLINNLDSSTLPAAKNLTQLQDFTRKLQHNIQAALQENHETAAQLAALCEIEAAHTTESQRLAQLKAKLSEITQQEKNITTELAETALPAELAKAEEAQRKAANLATQFPLLKAEFSELNAKQTALLEAAQISEKIADLQEKLSAATTDLAAAKAEYQQIFHAWKQGFAAQLAANLTENTACPVCGSKTHPAPVQSSEILVSETAVENAQAAVDITQEQLNKINQEIKLLRAKQEATQEKAGNISRAALHAQLTELTAKISHAEKAENTAAQLLPQVQNLTAKIEQLRQMQSQLSTQKAAFTTEIALLTQQLTEKTARLTAARATYPTVKAALAHTEEKGAQLQTFAESQHKLSIKISALANAVAHVKSAISESNFSSLAAVRTAALSQHEKEALAAQIKDHTTQLQTIQARLNEPEIIDSRNKETPDLVQRRTQLQQYTAERKQLAEKAATAAQFATDSQRLEKQILCARTKFQNATHASKDVLRLADIASAQQSQVNRVPLEMWVLLKRFEEVIARANLHLHEISHGRYELTRSEEGGRIKKTGLGLSIIDRDGSAFGDTIRPTTSLSGGETFYTSLALALALAEVVQEEAGGIRIETLLIDEGFGTLSEEIRDLVFQTLNLLQRNGRKIGIVSHVPQLKQLIANRISIYPQKSGESTLKVIS